GPNASFSSKGWIGTAMAPDLFAAFEGREPSGLPHHRLPTEADDAGNLVRPHFAVNANCWAPPICAMPCPAPRQPWPGDARPRPSSPRRPHCITGPCLHGAVLALVDLIPEQARAACLPWLQPTMENYACNGTKCWTKPVRR